MQSQSISHSARAARLGMLLIGLAATFWGTVGVTTRGLYEVSATNAFSIGFLRLALAAPVLLLASWLMLGRRMVQITRRDWLLFAAIGVLAAMYQVCLFSAIQFVGVAVAVVVTLCLAPVIVALASVRLFGEPLTRWIMLALVCALVGTFMLSSGGGVSATVSATVIGVLLASGSAAGYAGMALIGRKVAGNYHPILPITWSFTVGALVLLPFALYQGLVLSYSLEGWGLLLYMGLLPTAFAYVLFFQGMRSVSATTASVITLIEPLTAALLAWVLFGEALGIAGWFGAALLLAAIGLLYWNERQPEPVSSGVVV